MTPTSFFPDAQLATSHQRDLRAEAARARFARVATRTFALERVEIASTRRWTIRLAVEATRV